MIIWGIVWGTLLSLCFHKNAWILGALLGAIAGLTLRKAIRSEIQKAFETTEVTINDTEQEQQTTQAASAKTAPPPSAAISKENSSFSSVKLPPANYIEPVAPASIPPPAPPLNFSKNPIETLPPNSLPASTLPPPDPIGQFFSTIFNWLTGGNTVVRIGIVVLFFGLSFLAKYAADNHMFPIELRLALIGVAGIVLLGIGFRLRNKRQGYAMSLQGAGVATLYLTAFASLRLYALLEPGLVFGLMIAICTLSTTIALLQNAKSLAVIGFAGGFLAPVLTSTGQGNHIVLFSYYTLLNVAILFIALRRSWRILNLTGFFFTFVIATFWGVLRYKTELWASTQPFLIGFFLIYVLTAVLYALRNTTQIKRSFPAAVDGTLVFATPLLAFGLQAGMVQHIEFAMAFSALVLGAFYLLLALVLFKRQKDSLKLLCECFLALGAGFATLAVPLALDARWTTAVWAVEGAGVFWVGMRQGRWVPRAFGLALQGMAAISFISTMEQGSLASLPFANPAFIGALMLAFPAFAIAFWTRQALAHNGSTWANNYASLEKAISNPAFLIGFFWWLSAFAFEIQRLVPAGNGIYPAIDPKFHADLFMLNFLLSAFVAERIAHHKNWPVACWPAYLTTPVLLLTALANVANDHLLMGPLSWAFWLLGLTTHGLLLYRLDRRNAAGWFSAMHAMGVWVLLILLINILRYAINQADLWHTAWASVVLLSAGTVVLLLLASLPLSKKLEGRWPFMEETRFVRSYTWLAAVPLAVIVLFGALFVAIHSRGNAEPLPYLPVLNPTDLSVALGLGAIAFWLAKLSRSTLSIGVHAFGPAPKVVLSIAGFIALNTAWLRVAHHFGGVAWDASALFHSFLVQTGYAILWTVLAVLLMVVANRKQLRILWMTGAGLLGLTVAKLFLIDLSNTGGSARIVAFIGVGVLMLIVGYLAPLPPKQSSVKSSERNESESTE